jgi:HlyD family secretion protein
MVGKKKRIRWNWVVLVILAIAGGGFAFWQQRAAAGRDALPKGVQVGIAQRGDIDQKISATGVVAAQTGAKVNIGSEISGRIKSLPADVGAVVRKGQVVAVISSPDLEAQVEQQQRNVEVTAAGLEQVRSRLAQAQLNMRLTQAQTRAQIDEARFGVSAAGERLHMAEATSRLQPTQTATEIARAEAALSTAKSQQKQTQATVALHLKQAETDIDDARAALENVTALRRRQEKLLALGYISGQEVDDTRSQYRRAIARLQNLQASLSIIREKNEADLQAARDQVAQAQAVLNSANASREQDKMRAAEMRNAAETVKQAKASLTLRGASRTQDTIRKREVEGARVAVAQSQASLKQAQAVLRYQQAQLDKAVIHSPIGGTVLTVNTQQGETVAAGFQVQTLITVADLNRLEVRAYVDEVDIGRVRLGLPAEVRVESYPDGVFHGRVSKIAAASTVKDNVVTYETTVAIDDANGLLRPDMTADVTLILGRQPDVLLVPSEAVHRETERSIVYVLRRKKQGKERVETRAVTVGVDDGTRAQIRTGLKEGEEVILAGLKRLGVEAVDAQTTNPKRNKKE